MALDLSDKDNIEKLAEFIRAQSGGSRVGIKGVVRLGGGAIQDNFGLNVSIDDVPTPLVLRSDAPTMLDMSLSRAEEFAVLQAAFQTGVKVAEPLWLCDNPALLGRNFFIMRHVPGSASGRELARGDMNEMQRSRLVQSLGTELARVHSIKWPGRMPDLPPALARIHAYRAYLDRLPSAHPVIELALRWLELHMPPPNDAVFCHGDFRTGNYLVARGELQAILDWEFAGYSDPLEDLGWFCARCWRFGVYQQEAGGIGDREGFYQGYIEAGGSLPEPQRVAYWEIMATVRWAVIALHQTYRHISGEQPSLELALTGHILPELEYDLLKGIETMKCGET